MTRKEMTRRALLQGSAALGFMTSLPFSFAGAASYGEGTGQTAGPAQDAAKHLAGPNPLTPPATGAIPVAFPISDGAVVIDFCGPYEVLRGVTGLDGNSAFQLYLVADKIAPIKCSGEMLVMPNYTLENAPAPKVIVIPAQNGASEAMIRWIRASTKATDVTMSVCTGAFVLAQTGLLSGKAATTHHYAYADLALQYPNIQVMRGYRFVEEGKIATAGGLTSGMDLALRLVERYYGREKALDTADNLEYQGKGWMDSSGAANQIYAKAPTGTVCVICGMPVDPKTALNSAYQGHVYYFCSQGHKDTFHAAPEKAIQMAASQ
jgi:YHS domain-containing protein/putative intracellular protease/amidase